jgi:hypothetical protein
MPFLIYGRNISGVGLGCSQDMTHAIPHMRRGTSIRKMCREHSMQMSVELENGKFAGESASNCCDRSLYIAAICINLLFSIQS